MKFTEIIIEESLVDISILDGVASSRFYGTDTSFLSYSHSHMTDRGQSFQSPDCLLVGSHTEKACQAKLDRLFSVWCDPTGNRTPISRMKTWRPNH